MLNNKNYSIEDKIETKDNILSLNLLEEETILISFKNSIKQLKIENDKIIIKDCLNNIEVSEPGIANKYQNECVWTNGEYIEFSFSGTYNYPNELDSYYFDYESKYYLKVINLVQFLDGILFIVLIKSIYQMFGDYCLMLGSYKKGLSNQL